AGIASAVVPGLSDALRLDVPVAVARIPGWAEGRASVQDGSAQLAVAALAPRPGERVLDACAAPGGKAAQIAGLLQGRGELLALDRDARRLARLEETLARLGLASAAVQVRAADAGTPAAWWDGRPFDAILLDAPCSATGIIRRQPDVKWHRRADDIPALAAQQARLLDALWPLLAPGGRLLYATCSVLRAENAAQVGAFLAGRAWTASSTRCGASRPEPAAEPRRARTGTLAPVRGARGARRADREGVAAMKILILGAGQVGSSVAASLASENNDITVV